jgi:carboxyl-terminal processing protease
MRQHNQVWWVSATVLSLAAFSFFAGLGLRGLITSLRDSNHSAAGAAKDLRRVASAAPNIPDPEMRPQLLYRDVLHKLELYYVEPLPARTNLANGSVDAMLNDLKDPNTRLLSKYEVDAYQSAAAGEFPGLGAVLTIRRYTPKKPEDTGEDDRGANTGVRTVTVVTVAPGSPAEKVGLLPGDRITEIDGHWIAPAHVSYRVLTQLTDPLGPQDGRPRDPEEGPEKEPPSAEREKLRKETDEARARWKTATDLPTAMQALNGAQEGEHELTVERGTPSKTMKVKVSLGTTRADVFTSRKLNPTTGYLQIFSFSAGTPKQVSEALADFEKSGVKNLVVDLRHSAGGSIEAAAAVAGMLLGDARFAVLKERDAGRKLVERPLMAKASEARFKPAMVSVLVDGGTAGTSELLAAALRDNLGARLVGTTTFGDGTEQDMIRLDNGSGVSITRARMLTSKGVDFDGKGLQADVAPQGDPLEAAVKVLSGAVPAPAAPAKKGS